MVQYCRYYDKIQSIRSVKWIEPYQSYNFRIITIPTDPMDHNNTQKHSSNHQSTSNTDLKQLN